MNITVKTGSMDKAAFLLVFGGKLEQIYGSYPDNVFEITTNRLVAFYEALGGAIPYKKFTNTRHYLKRVTRKMAGLPAHFTGNKDAKFTLNDLAVIVPWKQK